MNWYYRYLIGEAVAVLFVVLPLAILAWAFWRWARSSPRIVVPPWRSYVALAAIGLAGISSLLWLTGFIWARVIGGFPFYDPVHMSLMRCGILTSFVGLLVSFVGKGKLRWPACGVSLLMTLFWAMAALAE